MNLKQLKQFVVAGALLISSASFGSEPMASDEKMSPDCPNTTTAISTIPEEELKIVGYSKIIGENLIKRASYEFCDEDGEYHYGCDNFFETTYKLLNSCVDEIKIVKLNDTFGVVLKFHNQNILDILEKINQLNPNNSFEYNEDSFELTIAEPKKIKGSKPIQVPTKLERLCGIFEGQKEYITPKLYNDIATSLYSQSEESVMNCLCYELNTLSDDFTNVALLSDFKKLFKSLADISIYRHFACAKFLLHPDVKPLLSHEPFLELYTDLFSLLPKLSPYAHAQRKVYEDINGEIANACFNFYLNSEKDSDDQFKYYKKVLLFSVGKKDQSLANKAFQVFTSSCASDSLSGYEGPKIVVNKESLDTIIYMSTMIRDLKKKLATAEKK